MKSSIYEGYGLLADMLGADETAKENRDAAKNISRELAARPQPTQTASIVEEAPEIVEKFSEGNVLEGFNKLAGQAETLTATALPSLAPTVAAIYGTAITGKWLKYIPRVGKPAYWLYRTVGSLLPGYLQGSGQIYKTAKDIGAKDEDAKIAAVGGGIVSAAIDRFSAGATVKAAVQTLGKKETQELFKNEFGKEVADKVVEEGLKQSAPKLLAETVKKLELVLQRVLVLRVALKVSNNLLKLVVLMLLLKSFLIVLILQKKLLMLLHLVLLVVGLSEV